MRLCKTFPRVFPPTVSSQNFVLNLDLELILEPYSSPCSTSSSLLTRPVSLILIYMKIFDTSTFMEEYFTCNVWAWPRCLWSQHPSSWKNNISPRCFFWMSDPRTLAAATFHLWAHLSKTTEIFLFTERKFFFPTTAPWRLCLRGRHAPSPPDHYCWSPGCRGVCGHVTDSLPRTVMTVSHLHSLVSQTLQNTDKHKLFLIITTFN